MQHGIDVMENVFLADLLCLAVVGLELLQAPVGNVVDALAGGSVAVEGDTLGAAVAVLELAEIEQRVA